MKRHPLLKDLTGQTIGNWTILRRYRNKKASDGKRKTKWLCQCACGTIRPVLAFSLNGGGSKSCGCLPPKIVHRTHEHFIDLTGHIIGNWKVLYRAPNKKTNTMWWCQCSCGTRRAVHSQTLRNGTSRSCGCLPRPNFTPQVINLAGRRFGKLLVVERANRPKNSRYAWWTVQCDCGKRYAVSGAALRAGQRSCGCVKAKRVKHGHTAIDPLHPDRDRHSPTYRTWRAMIARCTNPRDPHWPKYGGSGITVCKRWLTFANFLKDMGERPLGHTLDRYPNKRGGYKPSNCRWATPAQQAANRETTVELRAKAERLERTIKRLRLRIKKLEALQFS